MEKNSREVRRGGVVGKRHVSATRRSRATSGFKYSSGVGNEDGDEMVEKSPSPNPRLQENNNGNNKERSRKHQVGRMSSPSLQEASDYSCKDLDRERDRDRDRSHSKRKRLGLQEPQNNQSSSVKDMDDNSDDNTEMGRSEDDDDLPPTTVPRRRWKLKLHGKPREDLSPIDPAPVPRKLRTAMTKRPQESSPHVHVADVQKQQRLSNDLAAAMSAPASSNVVSNPGRKKRPDNQKPPTAKLAKISSTKVSKTEVEVAETLFDLARMFTIHTMPSSPETKAEPILAAKSGSATTGTGPDMKRSPGASNADTASPSSSFAQSQPGVLKKKRPRMSLKTKEEGLTSVTGMSSSAEPTLAEQAHCFQLEKGQSQVESRASPKAGTLVAPVIGPTAASPDVKADLEIPVSLEAKAIKMEASSPSMEIRSTPDPSEKLTISNSAGPANVANKDSELAEDLVSRETTEKLELDNRPPELAPKDGGSINKFEIDLMAPPQSIDKSDEILDSDMPHAKEREQILPDNQKGDGNLDSNKTNTKEKEQVDLADIPSAEIAPEDKERKNVENSINIEIDKENKQPIESSEHDECNDRKPEKDNGIVKERNDKTDALKDRSKQEIAKQTLKGTGNNAKPDPLAHRCDSNASAKVTTTSNLRSTSIPLSMAGWPAGFPPLGYYPMAAAAAAAAVAASWTTPPTMTGMSTGENNRVTPQLPSFCFPPQQARKRCATHVHITHLIDGYQKMKSNPLFAVAYANPTTIYGNGIMGTPVSSTLEPEIRPSDLAVGPLKEKEPAGAAPDAANVHGGKEKANSSGVDASEIKSSQKQTQTGQKNTSVPVQNDPVLGLPVNISAAASVSAASMGTSNTAGSNVLVTAAMFSGGTASSCNSSITSTGNGLQDGSVAPAAVLQSQLLNSAIQQPFPFSITSGHFASPYGGHLVQQVPQFFGNFYETHMVSQQLATTTSPSAPQKQPKNSQGSFPSGASQPQHQETSQASLASSGVASQPPKHPNEKSIMMESRSAKKQVPIVQRTMYGQNFPPALNSQAGVLASCTPALPIHSQDFSLLPNFVGKPTGKIKQQAQVQVLPQQQMTAQVQKQQKAYVPTQYHASAPAVQTELKDFDSKVSQSPLNRGPVNPDLSGLSGVASIMTSQGELLQSMVDLTRGHNQSQKTIQNQMSVGQSHQYSMSGGHDQKMHQRHALMERVVANNTGESGRITNEGIYGKVGHDEIRKEPIKYEIDQSPYFPWDSSRNMQGSQTNTDPKRGSTVNSTVITFSEGTAGQAVTVGKLSTGQGIHFPGQIGSFASQGLRRSHAMQDSAQLKTSTITSVGSLLGPAGGTPPQAMQGAISKSEGQQPRSEQLTMNSGSRITPAPSISSSPVATSTLPSLQSVSKPGAGATTKNSASVKDSHSSLQKSTLASASSKGISTTNMASVLGPGQPTTLQVQVNQNHYSIQQQQHHQHLRHQQTVQFMDSAQKHQGQSVLQNYPLNQNYSQQTNKHPSSQQQHLQFGQHILFHQPPIQYEVGIQSQVHSQSSSQSPTLHHQQTLQQLQQPPRQAASLTQQLGSIQQPHIKHLQPVLTTPFGISVSGNLSHNIGTIDAGNASLSIVSDGVTTTAKATGEINKTCSGSKTSRNDGSVLPHGHNGVVASLQHVSSSNTVSVSYPNSVLQTMPGSGAAEKHSEKTNQ